MRLFDALWAFRYDGVVPDELEGALLGTSLSTYGWVWLIVGVILIVSSFAVLNRSQFARWIGIIAGAVAGHLGDLVDAVLPGVVTHVRLHRRARRVRPRRPRRPRPAPPDAGVNRTAWGETPAASGPFATHARTTSNRAKPPSQIGGGSAHNENRPTVVAQRPVAQRRRHRRHRGRAVAARRDPAGLLDRLALGRAARRLRRRRRQRRRLAGAGVPRRPALGADARARRDRPQRAVRRSCCSTCCPGVEIDGFWTALCGGRRPGDRDHGRQRAARPRRRRRGSTNAWPARPAGGRRTPTSPTCPASCSSSSTASPMPCSGGRCAPATCPPCTAGSATAATASSRGRPGGRRRPASASAASCTARPSTCRRSAGSTRRPARSSCPTTRSARRRSSRPTPTATVCSPTTARATATCSPATPSGPC